MLLHSIFAIVAWIAFLSTGAPSTSDLSRRSIPFTGVSHPELYNDATGKEDHRHTEIPVLKRDAEVEEASCFCPGTQFAVHSDGKCECIDDGFGGKRDLVERDPVANTEEATCFCPETQFAVHFNGQCQCIDDSFGGKRNLDERDQTIVYTGIPTCQCSGLRFPVLLAGRCECWHKADLVKRNAIADAEEANCFCPGTQYAVHFGGKCQCIDDGFKKRQTSECPNGAPNICVQGECFCLGAKDANPITLSPPPPSCSATVCPPGLIGALVDGVCECQFVGSPVPPVKSLNPLNPAPTDNCPKCPPGFFAFNDTGVCICDFEGRKRDAVIDSPITEKRSQLLGPSPLIPAPCVNCGPVSSRSLQVGPDPLIPAPFGDCPDCPPGLKAVNNNGVCICALEHRKREEVIGNPITEKPALTPNTNEDRSNNAGLVSSRSELLGPSPLIPALCTDCPTGLEAANADPVSPRSELLGPSPLIPALCTDCPTGLEAVNADPVFPRSELLGPSPLIPALCTDCPTGPEAANAGPVSPRSELLGPSPLIPAPCTDCPTGLEAVNADPVSPRSELLGPSPLIPALCTDCPKGLEAANAGPVSPRSQLLGPSPLIPAPFGDCPDCPPGLKAVNDNGVCICALERRNRDATIASHVAEKRARRCPENCPSHTIPYYFQVAGNESFCICKQIETTKRALTPFVKVPEDCPADTHPYFYWDGPDQEVRGTCRPGSVSPPDEPKLAFIPRKYASCLKECDPEGFNLFDLDTATGLVKCTCGLGLKDSPDGTGNPPESPASPPS